MIALVAITEVVAQASRIVGALTPMERATYDALRIDKRRRDWLAGRVAAKLAVQRRTGRPFSAIQIDVASNTKHSGRPYWGDQFISIAHAGDIAGAVVCDHEVGLDVEVVSDRPHARSLAFGARRFDSIEDATLAWCELEATAKWHGVGFRAPFDELAAMADDAFANRHDVDVERGLFDHRGVTMAYACIRSTGRPLDRGEFLAVEAA